MTTQEAFDEAFVAVKDYIDAELGAIRRRLADIEAKGVEFCGVWQRACDYRRGSMVVDAGSLYAAVRDVKAGERPGASESWQLAAKSGKDGKDAVSRSAA
jgi:hypothetical protein